MVKGRKPAPPALRLIRGDKRVRGLAVAEPVASAPGDPVCPVAFDAAHRAKWHEVIEILREQRTLGRDVGDLVALYVVAVIEARTARAHVAEHGAIVASPRTGVPQHNPWRTVAVAAEKAVLRYAVELGLTPSSRSRVARTPEGKTENPFSAIG